MDYYSNGGPDLGLDPSDPLNMLLHNSPHSADSSIDDSSSQGEAAETPDWSQLAPSFWNTPSYIDDSASTAGKFSNFDLDMAFSLGLAGHEFDNQAMAVDPSALHFNPVVFQDLQHTNSSNQHLEYPTLDSSSYPFTFAASEAPQTLSIDTLEPRQRAMSVTSSSSSSGASLSPIPEASIVPSSIETQPQSPTTSAADELAQRVRQSAGVMLAVSAGSHGQQASQSGESHIYYIFIFINKHIIR